MWLRTPRARALPAAGLAALLLAAPQRLDGQIVAVDAGILDTETLTEPVAELYLAAAPWRGVRPYVIASWTPFAEFDPEQPTIIAQLAVPLVARGRFWSSVDTGVTLYAFRDYEPDWSLSGFAGLRLTRAIYLFAIPSTRPARDWERSLVVGLGRTLYFRR